ncbi:hypothetical protein HZQ15_18775 [Elizabethkingia anophelis]|nr:hypothetical protein [Elizabethkingia anophelis]MCT4042843.1 hypothetical protein [Elizabethkingia anophelis]
MEIPKQQAIKAAYGEYWDKVKDYVDEDGWCTHPNKNEMFPETDDLDSGYVSLLENIDKWMPTPLDRIIDNNGWTRIESESDLPKPKGVEDVLVIGETGEITVENSMSLNDIEVRRYWLRTISHWQPFIKPNLPLY